MKTFDLSGYFRDGADLENKKQKQRRTAVEAALEILKAEAQNAELRINYNKDKNLIKIYADQIEEALKVEDE